MSSTRRAREDAKSERKQLYFDLICGLISAVLAVAGITGFAIAYGITSWSGFLTGLIFWVLYMILSLFLIGIGLYTRRKERQMWERGEIEPRKDVSPPML
jgi:predicted transporter